MPLKPTSLVSLLCALAIFSSCQKELSYTDSGPIIDTSVVNSAAIFKFSGAPGSCLTPVINGTYEKDTLLNATNTVIVQANVTKAGTFTVSTANVNGIEFSSSDSFTVTGLQTIVLKGTGKPIASGTFSYTAGTGGCSFSITVTDPVPVYDCKDCIYYPICVGSKYSYYDTSSGTASIRDADILSSADTVIDAVMFKKLFFNTDYGYYNCTNGVTTAAGYHVVLVNGTPTLEFYKAPVIKANAAVGATWADTLRTSTGQTLIQNLKIDAKGISRTVGIFNFPDVIVVSVENLLVTPGGNTPVTRIKYYFAKGVGLVEIKTVRVSDGKTVYHSVIKSYLIP
ncbi:MAG: hypothetical protein ABIN67_03470 [Ferruginibacter sp.]